MLSLLRNLVNQRKEQEQELWRWNAIWEEYRRWLNEFPHIAKVLDNMKNAVKGKDSMDAGWPPSPNGPWTISNLREHLRRQSLNVSPTDQRYDDDWYAQFNKKHEEVESLKRQLAQVQKTADDATSMLITKNREVNNLRVLCGQAYHQHRASAVLDDQVVQKLFEASINQSVTTDKDAS